MKVPKLYARDFAVQAPAHDVLKPADRRGARKTGVASPLLDVCHALFEEIVTLGYGHDEATMGPQCSVWTGCRRGRRH
ncbi:hypothetical protein [Streptomyces sp. Ag109_O5-10]|uniref:hypothetical protein n=1 Tax=Streptomyces sp. Ag109_O5-10 TaxID=1855349 RepID=UPI000B819553